jgi:hypothetical protein
MDHTRLQLRPRDWYGWQMLPGYTGTGSYEPYYSPIQIGSVTPLKTGRRVLKVEFFNRLYAQGVQPFTVELRILKHEPDYLIAELYEDHRDRAAIISRIDFTWIRQHCPHLTPPEGEYDDRDVATYLQGPLHR